MPGKKALNGLPALIRFWDKIERQPGGCWLWDGAHKSAKQGSYPMFCPVSGESPVHAVGFAFEAIRGVARPRRGSGKELSHQPDVCEHLSKCANPWHVELEDHKTNLSRRPPEAVAAQCAKMRAANPRMTARIITACPHTDKRHYGQGKCRNCWVNDYWRNRYKTDAAFRAKLLAASKQRRARKKEAKLAA